MTTRRAPNKKRQQTKVRIDTHKLRERISSSGRSIRAIAMIIGAKQQTLNDQINQGRVYRVWLTKIARILNTKDDGFSPEGEVERPRHPIAFSSPILLAPAIHPPPMSDDQARFAARLEPTIKVDSNVRLTSKFLERLTGPRRKDKQKVGLYVVDSFRFQSCFLADGSSAHYVMLAILARRLNVTVRTVNVGVAMEYVLGDSNATVIVPEGCVDNQYAGIYPTGRIDPLLDFVEHAVRHSDVSFLPTTALFFEHGICAGSDGASRIKEVVAPNAKQLVILADWGKLAHEDDYTRYAVFKGNAWTIWERLRRSPDVYVVTTKPPSNLKDRSVDRYNAQAAQFRACMENRFMEL